MDCTAEHGLGFGVLGFRALFGHGSVLILLIPHRRSCAGTITARNFQQTCCRDSHRRLRRGSGGDGSGVVAQHSARRTNNGNHEKTRQGVYVLLCAPAGHPKRINCRRRYNPTRAAQDGMVIPWNLPCAEKVDEAWSDVPWSARTSRPRRLRLRDTSRGVGPIRFRV